MVMWQPAEIQKAFANLDVSPVGQEKKHLHAKARHVLTNTALLRFLPAFHAIISPASPESSFSVVLITYFEREVDSEVVDSLARSRILQALDEGQAQLCQGVIKLPDSQEDLFWVERVGDRQVTRSSKCKYVIYDSGQTACTNCQVMEDLEDNVSQENVKENAPLSDEEPDQDQPSLPEVKDLSNNGEVEKLRSRAVDVNPDEKARVNKMKRRINTCPKCGKEFDILVQYCKHLQLCGVPDPSGHHCNYCLKVFSSVEKLNEHLRRKHYKEQFPNVSKQLPPGAEIVAWGSSKPVKKGELPSVPYWTPLSPFHELAKDEGFRGPCSIPMAAVSRKIFRVPVTVSERADKNKPGPTLCQKCGACCKTPLKLQVHMAIQHDSSETECICHKCGRVFPHFTKLNRHIYHYHNPNKPEYKCHSCDKTFNNAVAMYKHVKVHSKVKPFVCMICDYRALRRDNCRLHIKKVHQIESNPERHMVKDGKYEYDNKSKSKVELST